MSDRKIKTDPDHGAVALAYVFPQNEVDSSPVLKGYAEETFRNLYGGPSDQAKVINAAAYLRPVEFVKGIERQVGENAYEALMIECNAEKLYEQAIKQDYNPERASEHGMEAQGFLREIKRSSKTKGMQHLFSDEVQQHLSMGIKVNLEQDAPRVTPFSFACLLSLEPRR